MGKLDGKVAVITGGNSGMGFATAKLFVEEGAYVYITGRRQPELDTAVEEIGHNVTGVRGDVSNSVDMDHLYNVIGQQHDHINVIFANAGEGKPEPLGTITEEQFNDAFNVIVKGTLFTVQKALPLLQDGGSIILNSSIAAAQAWPTLSMYSAAKAAVRSLARTWGAELLDRRIRVNAISAGTIETPGLRNIAETDEQLIQIKQLLASRIPMKRSGTADEIAKSLVFLASDDSSFITGHELFVDGGAIGLGSTQLR